METRIISLVNHKGGVGKTTTTLNLGKALSLLGKKVLLVDIDPQANLTIWADVSSSKKTLHSVLMNDEQIPINNISKNLDIIASDLRLAEAEAKLMTTGVNGYFKLRKALQDTIKNYDFVLIDCPPNLGILTMNALITSNEVLIVVQTQFLALEGLDTILGLLNEMGSNLQLEWNKVSLLLTQHNRTVVSKDITTALKDKYKNNVYQTFIRQNVALVEASGIRQDIFTYQPECNGAEDYLSLAKEVIK